MRLIPLLRTTLGGLNAFDSPGMAVSFVMSFCLALQENMERNMLMLNKTLLAGLDSTVTFAHACMHVIMIACYPIYSGDWSHRHQEGLQWIDRWITSMGTKRRNDPLMDTF